MRVSLGQIIVLFLIVFLLFGDFRNFQKKLLDIFKKINNILKKTHKKKGT